MAKILSKANPRTKRVRNLAVPISADDLLMHLGFCPAEYRSKLRHCFRLDTERGYISVSRISVVFGAIGRGFFTDRLDFARDAALGLQSD